MMMRIIYNKLDLLVCCQTVTSDRTTRYADHLVAATIHVWLEEYLRRDRNPLGDIAFWMGQSTTHQWKGMTTPDHADPRNRERLLIATNQDSTTDVVDYPHCLLIECAEIFARGDRRLVIRDLMTSFQADLESKLGVECKYLLARRCANDFGLDQGYLEIELKVPAFRLLPGPVIEG